MSVPRRFWFACLAGLLVLAGPTMRTSLRHTTLLWSGPVSAPADPTIQELRADQPLAAILSPISADIDRDGDMDVVASSANTAVEVWINDGHGHFERRTPSQTRTLTAGNSVATSLPDTAAAAVTATPRWHASMPARVISAALVDTALQQPRPVSIPRTQVFDRLRPTRAPPAASPTT